MENWVDSEGLNLEEDECLKSPDGIHCLHWYDEEKCCFCGDD